MRNEYTLFIHKGKNQRQQPHMCRAQAMKVNLTWIKTFTDKKESSFKAKSYSQLQNCWDTHNNKHTVFLKLSIDSYHMAGKTPLHLLP